MTIRFKTFEISYNYFDPGTLVTPTSTRCPLTVEHVYRIIECYEPMYSGEVAICLVVPHPRDVERNRNTRVSTEYLRIVMDGELTEDQSRLKRPNFWYPGDYA